MAAPGPVPPVRPSGWWYAVPALGLLVAAIVGVEILRDGWRDAQRIGLRSSVTAPGEDQVLTIDDPGGYTIGYVGTGRAIAGEDDRELLIEELAIEVLPPGGSEPLPLARYEQVGGLTIAEDGTQYVPLLTVRFEERGDYLLRSRPRPGLDTREAVLVVSPSPFRSILASLQAVAVLVVVALFLAVLVTVILARARGRSRRALPAPAPPRGPGPPWPGPPWVGSPSPWG